MAHGPPYGPWPPPHGLSDRSWAPDGLMALLMTLLLLMDLLNKPDGHLRSLRRLSPPSSPPSPLGSPPRPLIVGALRGGRRSLSRVGHSRGGRRGRRSARIDALHVGEVHTLPL